MTSRILVVVCLLSMLGSGSSKPQQATKANDLPKEQNQDDMARAVELSKPSEHHRWLARLAGTWEFTGKHFSDDPNDKPIQFKGSLVRKPIWEGRYFLTETTGEKLRMPWSDGNELPYKDMTVEGYDNVKRKFVRAMIDNHWDTGILAFEGSYDAATETVTYIGELETSPGTKTRMRMLLRILDHDRYIEEGYEDHDGREVKVTELDYKRAKDK